MKHASSSEPMFDGLKHSVFAETIQFRYADKDDRGNAGTEGGNSGRRF
jgi:hypothetical protein